MNRLRPEIRKTGVLTVVLLLLAIGAGAEEIRHQPRLMPMPDLLKLLDREREWIFLPLADWQALVDAGTRPTPADQPHPSGAWIETARVRGRLDDDLLVLDADLVAYNAEPGPARCPLFAVRPPLLGPALSTAIADAEILTVASGQGLDLVLPAAGRHALRLRWSVPLAEGRGLLSLPRAVGLDLDLSADRDGHCEAAGLVATGPRTWTVTSPSQAIDLTWIPGATAGGTTVWGVDQALRVILDDAKTLRWTWIGRIDARGGDAPTQIGLRLPEGWVATGAGDNGWLTSDDAGTITVGGGSQALHVEGYCPADAQVDLPRIVGAAWQGGVVALIGRSPRDWITPTTWIPLAHDDAGFTYRLGGPQPGFAWRDSSDPRPLHERVEHRFAAGPERWTLVSDLEITGAATPRFDLPLHLPAGWRLAEHQVPAGLRLLHEDSAIRLVSARGLDASETLRLRLHLERSAITDVTDLDLPRLDLPTRSDHVLRILAAPGLDLSINADPRWREATPEGKDQARLRSATAPPPVRLHQRRRPASVQAEAVVYLQVLDDRDQPTIWTRLDLRLAVHDADLDTVVLDLPLTAGSERLASAAGLQLRRRDDGQLALVATRPWRGERLVRIEGRLATTTATGVVAPVPTLSDAEGRNLPVQTRIALQVAGDLDLRARPDATTDVGDEDDLPTWSQPLPGDPVLATWRVRSPTPGSFDLLRRDLVEPPTGFVYGLDLRSQIAPSGIRTRASFRLSAPQAPTLALGLPPGSFLIAATIDGQAVAVRSEGGDLVLPLPGRTRVDVVLHYRQGPPSVDLDLGLPQLGGLPVIDTAWTAAIDPTWVVRPRRDAAALPLQARHDGATRPWFATWIPATVIGDGPRPLPVTVPEPADPRRLHQAHAVTAAGDAVPDLRLQGSLWEGRQGGDARLRLGLTPIDSLRLWDHLGAATAIALGGLLVWRRRTRTALAFAVSGLALAAILHGVGTGLGPFLALGEWLAPAVGLTLVLRAAARSCVGTPRTVEGQS